MDISLAWLNQYLDPHVSADEADDLLTQAGLPIESRAAAPGGDVVLDVEVTSNRGDCLSHVGCAREVAAMSRGRFRFLPPTFAEPRSEGDVASALTLENREPGLCPLFTARVFRGCRVGPSPAWLRERLEAVGQRPINNVVDITNFVTLELGNPCHVFDLGKLAGGALVVRLAAEGEKLRTLDGKTHTLRPSDLVVADAERATSLAGVMGGEESEVDERTTDIVFEMATWDPVTVRTQARRLNISTDAGYRFQRGVDARTIDAAARRAAALIAELSGGVPLGGVLARGAPLPSDTVLELRPERARLITGVDLTDDEVAVLLRGLEIAVAPAAGGVLRCTVPPHRSRDLTREIDLIEEVARAKGYGAVALADRLPVRVHAPQPRRRALREVGTVLTGLGFDETVTFSFTSPRRAGLFVPPGLAAASVDDERRGGEPTLRPSVLTGLLECRRANQDARSAAPGQVRLFEIAAAFAETEAGESRERQFLAMLLDVPGREGSVRRTPEELQHGARLMRGAIDAVIRATHGPSARAVVSRPDEPAAAAWDPRAIAAVDVADPGRSEPARLGMFGLLTREVMEGFGLEIPVIAAELLLDPLLDAFPPPSLAHALPSFPDIERDLSLIVDESVAWSALESMVRGLGLDRLEAVGFVGVYRGEQAGAGKKSVTMRVTFRDPERTLRREEVDPQVDAIVAEAAKRFQAQTR